MGCDQGKARERQEVLAETKAIEGAGPRAPGGEGPVSQPKSRACSTLGTWLGSRHSVLLPRGGANSFQWVWHYRGRRQGQAPKGSQSTAADSGQD